MQAQHDNAVVISLHTDQVNKIRIKLAMPNLDLLFTAGGHLVCLQTMHIEK